MKKEPTRRYKLLPSLSKKEVPEKKVCNVCDIEKPIGEFAKGSGYADGHRPTCKKCINDGQREMNERNKNSFPF